MNEFIIGYSMAFLFQVAALIIGFKLGQMTREAVDHKPDVKHRFKEIFTKVAPKIYHSIPKSNDIGPVERPNARQNYYRDNPNAAKEEELMTNAIDNLNTKEGETT